MAPIFSKITTFEDKIKKRNEIINKIKKILADYGITADFIESNNSEEEKIGGKKIIESAEIITSPENIEMLNSLFKRVEGGKRLFRTYRKKRGLKYRKTRRTGKNLK
jgi:hypothetical protein